MRRIPPDLYVWLFVLAAGLLATRYLVTLHRVEGSAMWPNLLTGDVLLVERWPLLSRARWPARGEVWVFERDGRRAAARIAGLPGDRVALDDGRLVLNGRPAVRWRVADMRAGGRRRTRFHEMLPGGIDGDVMGRTSLPAERVPADAVLVVGDNRAGPRPARLVPRAALVGRAATVLFAFDESFRWKDPSSWLGAGVGDRIGAGL